MSGRGKKRVEVRRNGRNFGLNWGEIACTLKRRKTQIFRKEKRKEGIRKNLRV